jgi:hypothetical protein
MSALRLESRALLPDWGPMPDGVFVELHVGGAVAVVLQRKVARDGEQIRFERSTRFIETPRRTNQREKALLGHVLGDIRPPGEPIDEAEHGFEEVSGANLSYPRGVLRCSLSKPRALTRACWVSVCWEST